MRIHEKGRGSQGKAACPSEAPTGNLLGRQLRPSVHQAGQVGLSVERSAQGAVWALLAADGNARQRRCLRIHRMRIHRNGLQGHRLGVRHSPGGVDFFQVIGIAFVFSLAARSSAFFGFPIGFASADPNLTAGTAPKLCRHAGMVRTLNYELVEHIEIVVSLICLASRTEFLAGCR